MPARYLVGGADRSGRAMMRAVPAVERQFRLAWPRWQPPRGDGVVVFVTQHDATLGWADALLARDHIGRYVWTSRTAELEQYAWEVLSRPEVRAATLARDGADPRHLAVALDVAAWLASESTGDGTREQSRGACLTSWSRPTPPPGTVPVPHLVRVRHTTTTVTDEVIWELTEDYLTG